MTVEQFDPSTSNSSQNQTTTLDIPSKIIEEHRQAVVTSHPVAERAAKVGLVSLGSRLTKELCKLRTFFIYDNDA